MFQNPKQLVKKLALCNKFISPVWLEQKHKLMKCIKKPKTIVHLVLGSNLSNGGIYTSQTNSFPSQPIQFHVTTKLSQGVFKPEIWSVKSFHWRLMNTPHCKIMLTEEQAQAKPIQRPSSGYSQEFYKTKKGVNATQWLSSHLVFSAITIRTLYKI